MSTIQTVTGPIDTGELGRTYMHEHVITRSVGMRENYPETFPRAEVVAICVKKLQRLKDAGIRTLVDLTTVDLGRDVELLAEVSDRSGMQVIACTGVWQQVPRWFHLRSAEEAATLFIKDIEEGVAGTGIRAGIIKCAVELPDLTQPLETVLRGCALAQRATGVPISTHTNVAARTGMLQQRIFREEGVDLTRVIIGHSGDSEDFEYLHGLLAAGSYLGMDRFGLEAYLPDQRRVEVVARLCAEGYTERLLLSHDANCWNDRMTEAQRLRDHPAWHYHRIPNDILPMLRAAGVTEAQIDTLLVANPRAIFEVQGGY